MKNQYIGDVGDYGKYGLLRYVAACGIKVGVNWYLTEDDQSNDGGKVSYLSVSEKAKYDPQLFNALKELAFRQDKNVALIEAIKLIPNAVYYSALLKSEKVGVKERYTLRQDWHQRAMQSLEGVDLVFCDPDNGPLGRKTIGAKWLEKYVSLKEIADYYRRGQNVVYYCHRARRTEDAWEKVKHEAAQETPDAKTFVLTFHGGTQRSYVFVVHPETYDKYRAVVDKFLETEWKEYFSEE